MVVHGVVFQYAESATVGRAIDHTGGGVAFGDLMPSAFDGVLAAAVHFIFPTDDHGFGKKGTQERKHFRGGF